MNRQTRRSRFLGLTATQQEKSAISVYRNRTEALRTLANRDLLRLLAEREEQDAGRFGASPEKPDRKPLAPDRNLQGWRPSPAFRASILHKKRIGEAPAMNIPIYAVALGIGFVAGLRTFTAPAAICWAARLGTLTLNGSPLSFMGSKTAAVIFTLLALAEYVGDLLPKTPSRTAPGPLIARIISGALCGSCLFIGGGHFWLAGAFLGGTGAVIGAFAGYNARRKLVEKLKVKDAMIAIPEDLVAIGLAWLLVA